MLFRRDKKVLYLAAKGTNLKLKDISSKSNLNCYVTYAIPGLQMRIRLYKQWLAQRISAHLKYTWQPAKNTRFFYLYRDTNKRANKQRNKLDV